MKRFTHPAIKCRADEASAEEYEIEGVLIVAYSRKDALDFYNNEKPHKQDQPKAEDELTF